MKVLVIGSDGFVGNAVKDAMMPNNEVHGTTRRTQDVVGNLHYVDLLKKETIAKVLLSIMPDVIISAAGIVESSDQAALNPLFTANLLEQIVATGLRPERVVITGSAAEYGEVKLSDIPVKETTPTNPTSIYGQSKLQESTDALLYAKEHDIPLVITRIFNPIGVGMHEKFLVPRILQQIKELMKGSRTIIEVSRLDSRRDYIDVRDVACGIKTIAEADPKERIYNIGSGISTSNGELIDILLQYSRLEYKPSIFETSPNPEALVAIQADITRMSNEFAWAPQYDITQTIKEIVNETN
jgi:GDP-4-dehydro-6-deoxy-D-mannose reductase